jgi:sugar O-acyltransferase (sialic acid O-acetyltransferase NeuD family)
MNKTKKCVIFGANGQAEVVAYLLEADSEYTVAAFCVSAQYREEDSFYDRPMVDFESVQETYPPSEYEMYVSLSYADQNKVRERFYHEAKAKGYTLLTYISSKTTDWSKSIGDNTFIFEDNTIQPFVEIGSNVILWSGNHIGHHSIVEDNCFISSHVVVSGHCKIGKNSFIGVNSTLRDGISIGAYNTLGAGCLMVKTSDEDKIFIGTKATEYVKKK